MTERTTEPRSKPEFSPPPTEPLNWLWQCHICNRVYQLGVTRRCLDDGHNFCAGTTTVKRSKRTGYRKTTRHKACASEFDYQGWKAWGVWRRNIADQLAAVEALEQLLDGGDEPAPLFAPVAPNEGRWLSGIWTKKTAATKNDMKDYWAKDCWSTCDYPSECRWGKQYGVQTPVVAATVTVPSSPPAKPETITEEETSKTSFDDILLDVSAAIADPVFEDCLEPLTEQTTPASPEETRKPSIDDLFESAKRRKRRSAGQVPSPLASNPPSPVNSEFSEPSTARALQRAFDDFELDIRKSFERAGEVVTSLVDNVRNSTAVEDKKAEAFVKGLKSKKKHTAEVLLEG